MMHTGSHFSEMAIFSEQNRTLYFDREVSVQIYKYIHTCILHMRLHIGI